MLGVLPWNTRHVLGGPSKDISILTKEVNELAFLFAAEVGSHNNVLAIVRASRVEWDLLGILGRLERGLSIRLLGRSRHGRPLASNRHDLVELAPPLSDDQRFGQLGAGSDAL